MADLLVESPLYQEIRMDGEQKGRKAESHIFLIKLLKGCFGEIDESIVNDINGLSIEQAEKLGVKVFKIETIEDFKSLLAETAALN